MKRCRGMVLRAKVKHIYSDGWPHHPLNLFSLSKCERVFYIDFKCLMTHQETSIKKVLVVDDDPSNLEVILDYVAETNLEILYAPNAKTGLELVKSECPDLVIMDWEMPVMNGIEAIKVLKADPETEEIPVVMATGVMTQSRDLSQALEVGAVDFLRKPFDRVEFRARLGATLRLSESYREIKRQNAEISEQRDQIVELNAREKKLLQQQIEGKERELSSSALFDYQKNELLNNLLKELDRLDIVTNRMYAPDIKKICRQIRGASDLDKSWNNFKLHFDEVHPGFFDEVNRKFPGLTNNEQRTCAYLRIGLGNKEIALLTNVESGSVRKALTRLKKKLDLGRDQDLRDYIKSL